MNIYVQVYIMCVHLYKQQTIDKWIPLDTLYMCVC